MDEFCHFQVFLSMVRFDYFQVFMSMVSFWLEPSAVPGRVTLGTSTWLTLITLTQRFKSFFQCQCKRSKPADLISESE